MANKIDEKLEVGDVVVLKSGGPPMTIKHVEDDSVTLTWMVNEMHPYVANLPKICLKRVKQAK